MKNITIRKSLGRVALAFSLLSTLFGHRAFAHTCPPDASATGVGVTVTALRTNGVAIGSGTVAPCEPIIIQMSILYFEFDPITLGKNAAFEAGGMNLFSAGRFDANVTPIGGIPLMSGPECLGVPFFLSQRVNYVVTQADVLAGEIEVLATYTNGNAHIGDGNLIGVVGGTQGFTIRVRPGPSCSIAPQSQTICAGANATFIASGTNGTAPYTFNWTGPGPFTFTGATLTITNAQPSQSGTYNVVIRDFFGCTNTCFATLTVNPAPTCTLTGPTNVCHPSTNTYTSNVLPPGMSVTHKWTITGPGVITSADNQPSVTVRSTGAGTYTLTSTVSANGCTNTCSTTVLSRICDANISLIKEIVCWTPSGCDPFDGSDTATGIRVGNRCPAFCYRITVANVSPPGVELRNLVVSDNELDLSDCHFPPVLTVPGTPGASFSCIISNVTHCEDTHSIATAIAIGVDAATGEFIRNVSTNDSVTAIVVPIAIVCDKFVSSPADLDLTDGPRRVTLPSDDLPHPVTYGVAVSNASTLPLIVFIQDPTLANCPLPSEFATGVALAPHGVQIWPNICTANLQCGVDPLDDSLVNTIVVSARVNTALTNVCPYSSDGREIMASNTCSASVTCPSPGACRTTGGGRQDADSPRGPLAWPLQGGGIDCLEGNDVRYVTHGGQVGAPVGNATTFDPDSECIQGSWEHVRHAQGGRRANFHAKSFDSLLCACLGEGSEPGVVIDGVCNPDDKKNGLGPLPRKAPANKITFTGVGDYTCQKGGRVPRACLFRVDLEDRSEPGGFHPGGARDPADRYRIRMWVLTPEEKAALDGAVNSLNDPGLCSFRRAIAATPTNTHLTDGAVDANGNAVPLGTAVFGVRRPDVDDGGEMQHGNHQIHPQIKLCTKPTHVCPAE